MSISDNENSNEAAGDIPAGSGPKSTHQAPKRKQARKGTIPLRALSARAARGTARKKNSALRERDALPSRSLALQYSRRRRA